MKHLQTRVEHTTRNNYLIIDARDATYTQMQSMYMLRMLEENDIRGLLNLHVHRQGRDMFFYYDISGEISFDKYITQVSADIELIRGLILDIIYVVNRAEAYLLPASGLYMNINAIYIDRMDKSKGFCYIPGFEGSFFRDLAECLSQLMSLVDHRDRDMVSYIYRIYQEALKPDCVLENLIELSSTCVEAATHMDVKPQSGLIDMSYEEFGFEEAEKVPEQVESVEKFSIKKLISGLYKKLNSDVKKNKKREDERLKRLFGEE